jgi:hypothetical protein
MADFSAAITAGVTLEPWDDPESTSPDRPSRINPRPEHIHKRWVGQVGVQITVVAKIGGSVVLDATLGGKLFSGSFHEAPSLPFPLFSPLPTLSCIQHFTPNAVGHYTFQIARPDHGGVILHVDVDS